MTIKFDIDKYFEAKTFTFSTKKTDKMYFKILSFRWKYKDDSLQGFTVQRYEFKRIKTIIVPIDDGINKEFKIQDEYELQSTNEDPIYYKYIYKHWPPPVFSKDLDKLMREEEEIEEISNPYDCNVFSNRLLYDDELTKYIDR